jgi:hypothetical protein
LKQLLAVLDRNLVIYSQLTLFLASKKIFKPGVNSDLTACLQSLNHQQPELVDAVRQTLFRMFATVTVLAKLRTKQTEGHISHFVCLHQSRFKTKISSIFLIYLSEMIIAK